MTTPSMPTYQELGLGRWVPDEEMHPLTNISGRYYAAADGSIHCATQFPIAAFGPKPALWFFPDTPDTPKEPAMSPAGRTVARLAAALSRLPWWVEDILAAVSLFVAIGGVAVLFWGFS